VTDNSTWVASKKTAIDLDVNVNINIQLNGDQIGKLSNVLNGEEEK